MDEIVLTPHDRLLVFAPHPDDESLGCGGLIHRASKAGATVNIVFVTGGDANPWPQRMKERRWRLNEGARLRWSAVRSAEAKAALLALGAGAARTEFLQWPDQGLTSRLFDKPIASVGRLRHILVEVQPTLVAMPSVNDSHPDHSALALMLLAALRAQACPARVLTYWLHGRTSIPTVAASELTLTCQEFNDKRTAALSHNSQGLFGTSRLLRFVTATEAFSPPPLESHDSKASWHWRFQSRTLLGALMCHTIKIIAISSDGTLRSRCLKLNEAIENGDVAMSRPSTMAIDIELTPLWADAVWVMAKLDTPHRLNVYDSFAWSECHPQSAVARAVNPMDIKTARRHEDVAAIADH